MIVADANVIVYLMLPNADVRLAALAKKLFSSGSTIVLPSLWRHEYLNTLARYIRGGHLDGSAAEALWWSALGNFEPCERPLNQIRALEICAEKGVAGFDAQYLALAEEFKAILVTEDKKLRVASPENCLSMAEWLEQRQVI